MHSTIQPEHLLRSQRAFIRDGAWASLAGTLGGGVILTGFALNLGASPLAIGLLSAILSLGQLAQLPGIALVERIRRRQLITVTSVTIARVLLLSIAFLPFLPDVPLSAELPVPLPLVMLLLLQALVVLLGSIAGCAINSWMHQLLPQETLGAFFARKMFWGTLFGVIGGLATGMLVEHAPPLLQPYTYSIAFAGSAFAGFISSWYLSRAYEPPMPPLAPAQAQVPLRALLRAPFADRRFRKLLIFMGAWNFAANLAAPFITVFLLRQLNYGLGTVTLLWVVSQIANVLTLYLWGRLSDRLSNKSILAVALPLYFACLLMLSLVAVPTVTAGTLPTLYVVHVVMGAASGGIGLAIGNLGLKLAPSERSTAFLATVSLVGAVCAAASSLLGGALAEWFSARELVLRLEWTSPSVTREVVFLQFRHWEFLFALAAAAGLYVMHALSRISEGSEYSEREVVQQFLLEAWRGVEQMSTVDGLRLATLFPFGRLLDDDDKKAGDKQSPAVQGP